MIKILYITPMLPYDQVPHASGKINNFIIKTLKESNDFDISLITTAHEKERKISTLQNYGVRTIIKYIPFYFKLLRYAFNKIFHHYSPFSKWGFWGYPFTKTFYISTINKLKQEEAYYPDIIVLAWVQVGFMINDIQKIYPDSAYIITAEDVWFQAVGRFSEKSKNPMLKAFFKCQYDITKKAEVEVWSKASLVLCNNEKDKKLIEENGILSGKILKVNPYFEDKFNVSPDYKSKRILFYGNLRRRENHLSVIWFIENVFKKLSSQLPDLILVIAGAYPGTEILKYRSHKIEVTGYVENTNKIFENASIFIAPMLLGAGIKIKVIEAMSSSLPVVTNSLGIEGINAINGFHYQHAEKEIDFENQIIYLLNNPIEAKQIGLRGRTLIKEQFDYHTDVNNLLSVMRNLKP